MGLNYIFNFNRKEQQVYAQKTGIMVDIQTLGKNTELLAVKEEKSLQELRDGVWLRKAVMKVGKNNFSNIYDFYWNPTQHDVFPIIHSANTPYSLYDHVKNNRSIVGAINGAYFFLTDIAPRTPHELPYNFCIRDSHIIGLPSSNEPVIFTKDGKLFAKEPKAKGIIQIKNKKINWIGAKNTSSRKTKNTAVLYNTRCLEVIKMKHEKTGLQFGTLDTVDTVTPRSPEVYDIVVCHEKKDKFRITQINQGGGTHYYEGAFTLQIYGKASPYKVGDIVRPLTLDGIDLQAVTSGITIGKRVNDPFFLEKERVKRRDARSIIAKDTQGMIHLMVFDGSKYVPGFLGVCAKDLTPHFSPDKYQWAYFLDGGGSSRLITKEEVSLGVYANQFAFKKFKNGKLLWDWRRARKIASSISLHQVEN